MRHALPTVLLLALALVSAPSLAAESSFRVKRLALATVYVDGGRDDGLKVGDRLEVVASETVVARMEVVALNAHTAACRVISLTRPIRTGDLAAPTPGNPGARSARGAGASRPAAPSGVGKPNGTVPEAATGGPATEKVPAASPPSTRAVASTAPDPKAEPPTKPAARPEPVGVLPGFDLTPAASTAKEPAASPALDGNAPGSGHSSAGPAATKVADGPKPVGTPPGFDSTPPASATKRPAAAPSSSPAQASATPAAVTPAAPSTKTAAAPPPGTDSNGSTADGVAPPASTQPSAAAGPPAPAPKPPSAAGPTRKASPSSAPAAETGVAFAALSPQPFSAPTPTSTSRAADPAPAVLGDQSFRVKYRSANNVYLEGGRAQGLMVGDQLKVRSGQTTVAELQVVYVAELSASCTVLKETRPVGAGDEAVAVVRPGDVLAASVKPVSSTVTASAPATPVVVAPSPVASGSPGGAWARVRGGASFGFYKTWDESDSGLDFEQRTGRLDLGLYDIAGQPLTFTVRGRTRHDIRARTLSTLTPASERVDRLYEMALRYEPPSDEVAFELGRIGLYRFVGIGYLDGFLGRYQLRPGLQLGAFGGRNAEIEGLGLQGTGGKYGTFVRLAPPGRYRMSGYDVLVAYVRENAEGDVSREYFSLESSLSGGGRWSLFQRAELDLNRGWRQEITGKGHQFSNLSFSGNLRVTPTAWAFASYDGRRNYRYYRNRIVPEEVFDDLLHQGLRAGLNLARPGGFGASASFGMRLRESDPRHPELDIANAYSLNAGLRHSNLFSSGFSAGLDGSGFTNGYAEGGLLSGYLGLRFDSGHMLNVSYGYSLYRVTLTDEDRTTQWLRFMGRLELGRRFYVLGDVEYDAGDDLQGPRGFLELGVIF